MASRTMWEIEVSHEGLNKYRHIRGSDRYVVEQKAASQRLVWDEMWEKKLISEKKRKNKEAAIRSKEEKKALAENKTNIAQFAINQLESTLKLSLSMDNIVDWSTLLDKREFPKDKLTKPKPAVIPEEPERADPKYQPKLSFFDKLSSKSKKKKQNDAEKEYLKDHESWSETKSKVKVENIKSESDYNKALRKWQNEKNEYEENQIEKNETVIRNKESYFKKVPNAIEDYCETVLSNSKYPEYFPQEWDLDYKSDSGILIFDYSLPDIESIPTIKNVKYVISRDAFTETHLSKAALNKLYDDLLYQIALRTIHELYESDVIDAVTSIVFNGWVDSIDKATGQSVNACIMSLQASKDEFSAINLINVDPKACFRQLKGVGSSKLYGLSPVAPIITIDKEDRRFVSGYEVVDGIDTSDNLAAMDWQDFENLIRELFEKEFVSSGGEVKITQASRDGGVDAIAFDPDPIRGGKIVIQAKRYTNVVGVSAVRDLYGTTVNEGATKGILVTTADYGPDAYHFAKGKPLTLLNGGNLLHLLEKHGHKAKIDLKEAKQILNEQKA